MEEFDPQIVYENERNESIKVMRGIVVGSVISLGLWALIIWSVYSIVKIFN